MLYTDSGCWDIQAVDIREKVEALPEDVEMSIEEYKNWSDILSEWEMLHGWMCD